MELSAVPDGRPHPAPPLLERPTIRSMMGPTSRPKVPATLRRRGVRAVPGRRGPPHPLASPARPPAGDRGKTLPAKTAGTGTWKVTHHRRAVAGGVRDAPPPFAGLAPSGGRLSRTIHPIPWQSRRPGGWTRARRLRPASAPWLEKPAPVRTRGPPPHHRLRCSRAAGKARHCETGPPRTLMVAADSGAGEDMTKLLVQIVYAAILSLSGLHGLPEAQRGACRPHRRTGRLRVRPPMRRAS